MTNELIIRKSVTGIAERYVATIEGSDGEAEITFTVRGPALISADHTHAPDSMRGMGVALKLVEHMIADARASGIKIRAVCPYVQSQLRKRPEWRDVATAS